MKKRQVHTNSFSDTHISKMETSRMVSLVVLILAVLLPSSDGTTEDGPREADPGQVEANIHLGNTLVVTVRCPVYKVFTRDDGKPMKNFTRFYMR